MIDNEQYYINKTMQRGEIMGPLVKLMVIAVFSVIGFGFTLGVML